MSKGRKTGKVEKMPEACMPSTQLGLMAVFFIYQSRFSGFVCVLLGYNCIFCVIHIKPTG